MKLSPSFDWLGERSRPLYGQVLLWILLANGVALAYWFEMNRLPPPPGAVRTGPATVFSFLPDELLANWTLFRICGVLYLLGALLWAGQLLLPWSSWLAALSLTATIGLYMENTIQATHVGHLTNLLLLVLALWYQCYHRDIAAARQAERFWTTPLFPRWVHFLCLYTIALFYTWAGLSKLLEGGLAWPNGVSLQLWTHLWGSPTSPWTHLVVSNRLVAILLQVGTLLTELGACLALLSPRLRPWIGLGLLGLHYGIVSVFGWAFHFNALLIALVFLPVDRWLSRWPLPTAAPAPRSEAALPV